ncbi:uncharacterized protein LOC141897306 [Acropora palmata]|uniref:uncharacterized protein LOC141897306 n=1 Tax=Acropora palmata TaxID=6131 RepID=UPI003DA07786
MAKIQGERQDHREPSIRLTILPTIEEYSDPPDPPDPPTSVEYITERYKHHQQEFNDKVAPQDTWWIPGIPTPDVDSKGPKTKRYTDDDFPWEGNTKVKNSVSADTAKLSQTDPPDLDLVNSDTERDQLPGIKRIKKELVGLLKTKAQNHHPPDELDDEEENEFDAREEFESGKDRSKQQSFHESEEGAFQNEMPDLTSESGEFSQRKETSESSDDTNAASVFPKKITPLDIKWHVPHTRTKRDGPTKYKVKKKRKTEDEEESNETTNIAALIGGMLSLVCLIASIFQICKCCKKKRGHQDDQEHGSEAGNKESGNENQSNLKRKGAMRKKKNEKMEKEDPVPSTSIQINEDIAEGSSVHVLTSEGITSAGDDSSVVKETLGSSALNGCESFGHQQSSVTTNATPAFTPTAETVFKTTPQNEPTDSRNLSENEHKGKESSASSSGHTSDDDERIVNKTASSSVFVAESPVSPVKASTSSTVKPIVESKTAKGVVAGAHSSHSSTESCKTPVTPLKEVVITIEDEEETKLAQVPSREDPSPCSSGTDSDINGNNLEHDNGDQSLLGSEYETSSGELIYSSQPQSKMDLMANSMVSPSASPPIPPPRPNRPNTSAEVKRGNAIGGRKIKNNRLTIKGLTSKGHSHGFLADLKAAATQILIGNFSHISKEKRKVIKALTKDTKRSFTQSIVLGKSLVLNEQQDTKRDKRCAGKRDVVRKALSSSNDSLSKQISFAKSVSLPGNDQKNAQRRNKETRKVIKTIEKELHSPSFQQQIRAASSTLNKDEATRDLKAKREHNKKVIKMDAKMMKLQRKKTTFRSDIKFVRSVICGPPAVDHVENPQLGCVCYYCNKHWKKAGGPPCFNPPKAISIANGMMLVNGMLFVLSSTDRTSASTSSISGSHVSIAGPSS